MAAGDSQVSIVNLGLVALGEPPITAMTDNRKAAIYASALYDNVRREVLRSHPWDFARKQAQLAANATAPLFDYNNGFALPSDFIRLVRLANNVDKGTAYEVIGRSLYTDAGAPLNVEYIYDVVDATLFDPIFAMALGYALGVALAMPLTQSATKKQQLAGELEGKLAIARLVSSQDDSPEPWDVDVLLGARN